MWVATRSILTQANRKVGRTSFFTTLSVSEVIQQKVNNQSLREDPAQQRASKKFSKLQHALVGYDNGPLVQYYLELDRNELIEALKKKNREENSNHEMEKDESPAIEVSAPPQVRIPRGLYIFGEVGTGKSMLMDTFYSLVSMSKKRRVHFHAFMQEVHHRIHALKQKDLRLKGRDFHVDTSMHNNPIIRVARQLASEISLLCFDEFQVTDVADALILKQLFSTLFQCGTVVVATSNRSPSYLYEGGINRSYFLPFIDLLERHCIVHELQSEIDYRRLVSKDVASFFFVGSEIDKFDETFERLLDGELEIPMVLQVGFQRSLTVKRAHPERLVARFTFAELCRREVGAADFRAISTKFRIIAIEDIPRLNLKYHNEARRFITLVDELYESRCALMCSSVYSADNLFLDSHNDPDYLPSEIEVKVGEAFGIDVAQSTGNTVGELASVRELSFAFRRASSRLSEMCCRPWWDEVLSK